MMDMVEKDIYEKDGSPFLFSHTEHVRSYLPEAFKASTFDRCAVWSDGHRQAMDAGQLYAEGVRQHGLRSLFVVYGGCGSGKTELGSCIWQAVAPFVPCRSNYDEVVSCGTADNLLFVNGAGIPNLLKGEQGDVWFRHASSAFFAVLDDLDKYPTGGWVSQLYQLIDSRVWVNRMPTIVTMNSTPREFVRRYGQEGTAIISRFERAGAVFVRLDPVPKRARAEMQVRVQPDSPVVAVDTRPADKVAAAPDVEVSRLQQALDAMPRTWGSGS